MLRGIETVIPNRRRTGAERSPVATTTVAGQSDDGRLRDVNRLTISTRRGLRAFGPRTVRRALPVALATASTYLVFTGAAHGTAEPRPPASLTATIAYAVDGDTLRIEEADGDLAYVRLVGIDTPEDVKPGYPIECGGRAAARSMDGLAPEGAAVTLRFDSVADHEDVYGRILAHAFVGGRQLELAQLRRGWAEVYRYDGQRFDGLDRFYSAQDSAQADDRGVWGRCGGDFHSSVR